MNSPSLHPLFTEFERYFGMNASPSGLGLQFHSGGGVQRQFDVTGVSFDPRVSLQRAFHTDLHTSRLSHRIDASQRVGNLDITTVGAKFSPSKNRAHENISFPRRRGEVSGRACDRDSARSGVGQNRSFGPPDKHTAAIKTDSHATFKIIAHLD
jgi:hypothetical protein